MKKFIFILLILSFYSFNAQALSVDMNRIKQIESSGNVFAFNEGSKARGLYQFRKIAWQDVQNHYPKLKKYEYTKYVFNKEISTIFCEKYFLILEKYLIHYNLEINIENLLIAWHDGIGNLIKYKNNKRKLGNEMKGFLKKYKNNLI